MKKRLYLNMKLAEKAIRTEQVESLAFAILIKLNFTDSIIKDATIRRCKDLFGIGTTKLSRIIKNAETNGYIRREGNNIIALKVKGAGYNATLNFDEPKKAKIKDVERLIREMFILNHIKKQTEFTDTCDLKSRATSGYTTPNEMSAIKKAAKRISNMSENGVCNRGLSMKRISALCGVSITTAKAIIRGLIRRGSIVKKAIIKKTDIRPAFFHKEALSYLKENGFGIFFSRCGEIMIQLSNQYRYSSTLIKAL